MTTVGYLHGMLGNPEGNPFVRSLGSSHDVIAPSLPGFMPSPPREDLRELYDWVFELSSLVDSSGLAGRPVIASSVGAMLALELAAVRPDAFSSLVLLSPLGLWSDEHPVADVFGAPGMQQRDLLLADPSKASVFFDDKLSAPADEALTHGVARYQTRRASAALIWPIPDHGLARRIHRVQCPVSLVWGDADRFNPIELLPLYERALPSCAGTHVVAGAGHCVEWDAPDEVAAVVTKVLT